MFIKLVALFILVPLVEFVVLVKVGAAIGLLTTVAIALGTAILGASLSRNQGFQVMNQIRQETAAGKVPAKALVEGFCILLAGLLLMTPGFVTDIVGFLLLVPGLRQVIYGSLQGVIQAAFMNAKFRSGSDGMERFTSEYSRRPKAPGEVQSSWEVLSTKDVDSESAKPTDP